jgi:hypothetical protein
VFASGATELWTGQVRAGHRIDGLGDAAMDVERPLHLARDGESHTLCGLAVDGFREYPVDFSAQEQRIRCPTCDESLGQPTP